MRFPLCQTNKPIRRLKINIQKSDQHAENKWLIHGTKYHKDYQLQSLELPCKISRSIKQTWHKIFGW